MRRVQKIWEHPLYQENYQKLQEKEADRIYCRHGIDHLLDVARIAYIHNLEESDGYSKAVIYAAALLHDSGRYEQYEWGIPHEKSGERIAREILEDLREDSGMQLFGEEEQQFILEAIANHRGQNERNCGKEYDGTPGSKILRESGKNCMEENSEEDRRIAKSRRFMELIHRSDKESRRCFDCKAEATCKWAEEKKNMEVRI